MTHIQPNRATEKKANPVSSYDVGLNQATAQEAMANDCWPEAEFPDGAAPPFIVGNLGLTPDEEAALVAYMKTLSDEFTPQKP